MEPQDSIRRRRSDTPVFGRLLIRFLLFHVTKKVWYNLSSVVLTENIEMRPRGAAPGNSWPGCAARVLRILTLFQTMNVLFYTLCQTRPRKSVSQVVAHGKSHGKLFTVVSIMRSQSLSRSSNYRTLIGRILVAYERW